MTWRIEAAPTGRAHCDECEKPIAKGVQRFGREGTTPRWYHLECAAAGAPRAFKPFEAEAATLIAARPTPRAKPPKPAAVAHDPELVERLLANPDDPATRAVFADWLQSHGDPWGELIAYTDAGKTAAAKSVMKKHHEALTGGFGAHLFRWKDGFIDHVSAGSGRSEKMIGLVEKIFALPATMLTRTLTFGTALDDGIAARLSACAPRTLRDLFCWLSNGVSELRIPSLVLLRLYHTTTVKFDVHGLRGLFDATHFPNVRKLELLNRLDASFVQALIDSKLLRQLRRLEMTQDCFDAEGARLLLANADAFDHLEELGVWLRGEQQMVFQERFARQYAAFQRTRATG